MRSLTQTPLAVRWQNVALVAGAAERPLRVHAKLFTASIVTKALINVCNRPRYSIGTRSCFTVEPPMKRPAWWMTSLTKTTLMNDQPDKRPPWWMTSLSKDHPDEWPAWLKTTSLMTSLTKDHPDEWPAWGKTTSLMRKDHLINDQPD